MLEACQKLKTVGVWDGYLVEHTKVEAGKLKNCNEWFFGICFISVEPSMTKRFLGLGNWCARWVFVKGE